MFYDFKNIIVGNNGVGKSTIIESLSLALGYGLNKLEITPYIFHSSVLEQFKIDNHTYFLNCFTFFSFYSMITFWFTVVFYSMQHLWTRKTRICHGQSQAVVCQSPFGWLPATPLP